MRQRRLTGLVGLLLLYACGSDFVGPMSVSVTPGALHLVLDQTQQLSVSVVDANGTAVPTSDVSYVCEDPSVATVSRAGLVTAVGFGITTIMVTTDRGNGTVPVQVKAKEFSITPRTIIVDVGEEVQITAGVLQYDTLVDQPVTWSSTDAAVATVSPGGLVTGVDYGLARIILETHGALPDTVPVRVGPELAGEWDGTIEGLGSITLWLGESDPGTLDGSVVFLPDFRATVQGSVDRLQVQMDWVKTGFETATFHGRCETSDGSLRGIVSGSGFTGQDVVFFRAP